MARIPDILNTSDELSEDSSSSTPSALSLSNSTSGSTSSTTPLGSSSSEVEKPYFDRTIKEEEEESLSDKVRHQIRTNVQQDRVQQDRLKRENKLSPTELRLNRPHTVDSISRLSNFPPYIPKCKVHKKLVPNNLVSIAIRRKHFNGHKDTSSSSKLHLKALEAGLRVKLTLAPNLLALYNSLTPHASRRAELHVFNSSDPVEKTSGVLSNGDCMNDVDLQTKKVQLIDNNLVNLSVFSNKVLKAVSSKESRDKVPTFNSLNTAVHSLFGISEFTLVRVTRSTTTDYDGSVLMKFETAKPGELSLIDDEEFADDLHYSIGKEGTVPNNLFIKKVVARPRYKSDMKIYLIPGSTDNSLYVDKRMLERDLINGIIDMDVPMYKNIYCSFDYSDTLQQFKKLVKDSDEYKVQQGITDSSPPMIAEPPKKLSSDLKPLKSLIASQEPSHIATTRTTSFNSPLKSPITAPSAFSNGTTSPRLTQATHPHTFNPRPKNSYFTSPPSQPALPVETSYHEKSTSSLPSPRSNITPLNQQGLNFGQATVTSPAEFPFGPIQLPPPSKIKGETIILPPISLLTKTQNLPSPYTSDNNLPRGR